MLLLLADKVQRRGDFSLRREQDAVTILRSDPGLDWDDLLRTAEESHLGLGMYWVLVSALERVGSLIPAEVLRRIEPPRWERSFLSLMAASKSRERLARRARALHRRVWVFRYVWGHPHPFEEMIATISGRIQ
jgi:hypothetical protein